DVTVATCNGSGSMPASAYHAAADPVDNWGSRYFATDKRGTIYQDQTVALLNPIPAAATAYR
ncbi:MAG: hypothetical protein AB7I13_20115, partial [Vicinamibacterales bacterium]